MCIRDSLILLRREGEPLILPRRALGEDQLALLERILTRDANGNHPPPGDAP